MSPNMDAFLKVKSDQAFVAAVKPLIDNGQTAAQAIASLKMK